MAVKIKRISLLGYSTTYPGEELYRDAYETAKAVAEAGYTVVNGGGTGVMEAASKGGKAGGGEVIGVTFYPKGATHFEGRDTHNPMDREIITENYLERTLKLLEIGEIYVIFNGGTGTISEFGMAWGMSRIYFGHHKPMVLYGNFWEKIIKTFEENMLLRPEELKVYEIATTPKETVEAIKRLQKRMKKVHDHGDLGSEKSFII